MNQQNTLGIRWLSPDKEIGLTQDGGFKFYPNKLKLTVPKELPYI